MDGDGMACCSGDEVDDLMGVLMVVEFSFNCSFFLETPASWLLMNSQSGRGANFFDIG